MAKQSKKINRWLKDEVFKVKLLILVGHSPAEAYKTIERGRNIDPSLKDFEELKGISLLMKTEKNEFYNILWIEDKKDFYTLMHECLHLVKDTFVTLGIPFDSTNHELIAYYQEYWFKKIWRIIGKK